MNTLTVTPKKNTREWLQKAVQVTGLSAENLLIALFEQTADRILHQPSPADTKSAETPKKPSSALPSTVSPAAEGLFEGIAEEEEE